MVHSYLEDRTFQVVLRHTTSGVRAVPAGVPQGSVLGPILFNIFINDIPHHPKCELALFADDTALYSSSTNVPLVKRRLQEHIHQISAFFNKWRVQVNADKTEYTIFSKRRIPRNVDPNLEINNIIIKPSPTCTYLGVILDSKLTFHKHLDGVRNRTLQAIGGTYHLLHKDSPLNQDTKRVIYLSCIRPRLLYCCPIWSTCSKTQLLRLDRLQNRAMRIILDQRRDTPTRLLRSELRLDSIHNVVLDRTKKLLHIRNQNAVLTSSLRFYTVETAPYRAKHRMTNYILL